MQKIKNLKNYNLKAISKITYDNKNSKYKIEKIKNSFTLLYDGKYVTSKYAPYEEAKRFIDILKSNREYEIGVFLGIASFHHIDYFLNESKESKNKIAIVIEKDIDLFSLVYNEVSDKLTENIVFLVAENENYIFDTLDFLIDEEEAKNVLFSIHIRSTSLTLEHKEYYSNIEALFYKLIKEKLMSFSTSSYFSPIWSRNVFLNLKLNEGNSVNTLKGILKKDTPVLLIAAGASIDNAIEKIKSLKDTHFIIAVSHALNTLIKNDIMPDIVITVDGGFYSSFHMLAMRDLKTENYKTKIITTHTAYPASVNNFDKNNLFYFSHNESFEKILFNETAYFPMEGSVIIPALRMAVFLEAKYIILAGVDFCYCDNKTHSKYSSIYDIYFNSENKLNTFENKIYRDEKNNLSVVCYDEVSRESDEKLLSYFRYFQKLISDIKDIKIYFLTKESAKLENVFEYVINGYNKTKHYTEINTVREKANSEIFYKELNDLYFYIKNEEIKKAVNNTMAKIISPMHIDNLIKDEEKYENDFKIFFISWFKSIGFTK